MHWERDDYCISDDPARLNVDWICASLHASYWAANRSRDIIRQSIERSIPLGLYKGNAQVGFARWVTDRATFAWLADVLIDPAERGRGLGKWLIECALAHPDVASCLQLLRTRDAHEFYQQAGFGPGGCMIRRPPGYPGMIPPEPPSIHESSKESALKDDGHC